MRFLVRPKASKVFRSLHLTDHPSNSPLEQQNSFPSNPQSLAVSTPSAPLDSHVWKVIDVEISSVTTGELAVEEDSNISEHGEMLTSSSGCSQTPPPASPSEDSVKSANSSSTGQGNPSGKRLIRDNAVAPNYRETFSSHSSASNSILLPPVMSYGGVQVFSPSLSPNHEAPNESIRIVPPQDGQGNDLNPLGTWRCCKCKRGHDIHHFADGEHPISTLNCVCTHRSCADCTFDGDIRRFQPMKEPEIVQLSEDKSNEIRFGVVCDACGLSRRAKDVSHDTHKSTTIQRISAVPKRLAKRRAYPRGRLRHSRSLGDISEDSALPDTTTPILCSTLNLRALSDEMEKGHGKQAECTTVRFTGLKCSCGAYTCATSLCFQVVVPPQDGEEAVSGGSRLLQLQSTPTDRARGHGTPVLTLKGRDHPNPLMSSPVLQGDWT